MSLYEFDLPNAAIDLPALGPLLADARDAGLVADEDESERIYSYRMYSDWKISPNWQRDQPLSGVSIILANYTIGRYAEYQDWYDNVHSGEVIRSEEHTSELQSLMRISYAVFCLKKKINITTTIHNNTKRRAQHYSSCIL